MVGESGGVLQNRQRSLQSRFTRSSTKRWPWLGTIGNDRGASPRSNRASAAASARTTAAARP
jgi:hypothetical protein